MGILPGESYTFYDKIDIPGEGSSNFTFATGWLIEIVHLTAGEYHFYSDDKAVKPTSGHFGVFYPPFTLVKAFSRDIKGMVYGIGAVKCPPELPQQPMIFQTDHGEPFADLDQGLRILNSSTNKQIIEVNTRASLLSLRAKRMIDENYLIYPSISRIAARIGVSPEHLSRQFKRDYGLSPSSYLHQLRVAEATFRLSLGEQIIDISQEVGYNDLSRFYKQFKKSTGTSPAVCRDMLER